MIYSPKPTLESRSVYLDNHSQTFPCSAALESLQDVNTLPNTDTLFDFIGADAKDKFTFTSSGAEAICQVLFSVFLKTAREEGKTHFIISRLEDAPTMLMLKRLETLGCTVKLAPVDAEGKIDIEKLAELIGPRTALVSISSAQGLTGVIQPLDEIAHVVKEKGALLHIDATYGIGKTYFSFRDSPADYVTFAGDRMHAGMQTGALFAKETAPLEPYVLGKTTDRSSLRSLIQAAYQSSLYLDAMSLEVARLRDHFEQELTRKVKAKPLVQNVLRLPNVSALCFPKVHQETLLFHLNRKNVFATIGGPYAQNLSSLLQAIGVDELLSQSAMSFALSRYTTEEELNRAVGIISEAVQDLQPLTADLF